MSHGDERRRAEPKRSVDSQRQCPRHGGPGILPGAKAIQLAELFATSLPNISMHISKILKDKELGELSVVQNHLTTERYTLNRLIPFNEKPRLAAKLKQQEGKS